MKTIITAAIVLAASIAPAALDHLRSLNATNAGVDRHGNFWAWDSTDLSVTTITPRGERATVDLTPDVLAIDVDRERGVVTLGRDGTTIRVTAFSGAVTAAFELPSTAANVCWMEGDQIAVAPDANQWRAEVWSTSRKAAVRAMGPVPEIKAPSAGAVLIRATLLRYDDKRDQLITLDAFTGDLVVFDRAGTIIRRAGITHPNVEANLLWLKELSERLKAKNEHQTPRLWNYARISSAPDGSIWLGEKSDPSGNVTIAKILPDGTIRRSILKVPECASVRFVLWQDHLVFFRSSRSSGRCVAIKESI